MFKYTENNKCHICQRELTGIQFNDEYGFSFHGAKLTRNQNCFLTYADINNKLHEVCPECFQILSQHMLEDKNSGYPKLKHTIMKYD